MVSRSLQKGALITREAYLALLELKSLLEVAVERTHLAGFETAGMAISVNPEGNPLHTLKGAAAALHSPGFDQALAEARNKVESAMAWHEELAEPANS
jgi:hypothetical protein